MIDLNAEELLTLAQAGRLLPPGRGNNHPTMSCLLRWATRGVKSPGGEIVRLEVIRVGGRWLTSREALQRFAERQTPDFADARNPPRSPAARTKASLEAARELEENGM